MSMIGIHACTITDNNFSLVVMGKVQRICFPAQQDISPEPFTIISNLLDFCFSGPL